MKLSKPRRSATYSTVENRAKDDPIKRSDYKNGIEVEALLS